VKGFATGAQANRRREGSSDPGRLDRCKAGIMKLAAAHGVGVGTVQRIKAAMTD
jgi:hypothetical protein